MCDLTFGAMPSIGPIYIASPYGLGAVERSPHYALPLNAETPTSHVDDSRLSAGYLAVLPARVDFTFLKGVHFPSRGQSHIITRAQIGGLFWLPFTAICMEVFYGEESECGWLDAIHCWTSDSRHKATLLRPPFF